jgi:hypothetical protein
MSNKQYVVEVSAEDWGEHHEWHEEAFATQADADGYALSMLGYGNAVRMYIREV